MREIKFRGKRVDNGEWVYGNPVEWLNETKDISIIAHPFGCCIDEKGNLVLIEAPFVCKVIPVTIGQFTGLHDKNGKEIYEGDILNFLDTGEEGYEYKEGYEFHNRACIVWSDGRFELDNIYDNNSAVLEMMNSESHEEFVDELMNDCEVIGNIHDNPDLKEVSHEA